jgi:hypothetical protein
MVIADLLRKGVVRVSQPDPLWIAPAGTRVAPNAVDLPDGAKVGLEAYEVGFLDVLSEPPEKVADKDFHEPLERLVGLVRYKMQGFDPKGTRKYYRSVGEYAWDRMKHETDPGRKEEIADRHLNWLTMDPDYEERMEREEEEGWHYRPRWYYRHGYARDRNWLHDMTRSVRPAAERSARGIVEPVKGLDLSGADRFTRDLLSEMAKGGGGGSGGGCACAGCACACACAGGGR